jgi:hypothetical protein
VKIKTTALDRIYSWVVRALCGWKCQICGKEYGGYPAQGLDCAHCFSRGAHSIRFDLDNAVAACAWCHKFSPTSLHNMGNRYTEKWFRKRIGLKKFRALSWKFHNPSKFQRIDEEEIKRFLLAEKAKLEKPEVSIIGARS